MYQRATKDEYRLVMYGLYSAMHQKIGRRDKEIARCRPGVGCTSRVTNEGLRHSVRQRSRLLPSAYLSLRQTLSLARNGCGGLAVHTACYVRVVILSRGAASQPAVIGTSNKYVYRTVGSSLSHCVPRDRLHKFSSDKHMYMGNIHNSGA